MSNKVQMCSSHRTACKTVIWLWRDWPGMVPAGMCTLAWGLITHRPSSLLCWLNRVFLLGFNCLCVERGLLPWKVSHFLFVFIGPLSSVNIVTLCNQLVLSFDKTISCVWETALPRRVWDCVKSTGQEWFWGRPTLTGIEPLCAFNESAAASDLP